jgi:hypothetical protein
MGKFIGGRANVDAVYPVVTDEKKGGSEEEEDDLYNSESLRSVGKLATEQDLAAALQEVAGIQVNEIALVQRSDKKWRYARLHKKSEDSMSFVLDSAGQTRKYPQQRYSEVRQIAKQICGQESILNGSSDDGGVSRLQQQLYEAIAAKHFRTTRAAFVFFIDEDADQPDEAMKDKALLGFISRTGFKVALIALGLVLTDHDRKALRKSLDGNNDKKSIMRGLKRSFSVVGKVVRMRREAALQIAKGRGGALLIVKMGGEAYKLHPKRGMQRRVNGYRGKGSGTGEGVRGRERRGRERRAQGGRGVTTSRSSRMKKRWPLSRPAWGGEEFRKELMFMLLMISRMTLLCRLTKQGGAMGRSTTTCTILSLRAPLENSQRNKTGIQGKNCSSGTASLSLIVVSYRTTLPLSLVANRRVLPYHSTSISRRYSISNRRLLPSHTTSLSCR